METTEARVITNIGGRNYEIHDDRIQFLDTRFYKCPDGSFVPSVTTVLNAYPKSPEFYDWLKKHGEDADTIRDEAGRRGSVVHNLTERYDYGEEVNLMSDGGDALYQLREWKMFERYVDFRERHPADIHAIELNMVSGELGYAGTLDRVLTIGDKTYLMDIKTSGAIHDTYWMQQAAYINLLRRTGTKARLFNNALHPIEPAILWLNASTRTYRDGIIQGPGWQFLTATKPTEELLKMFENVHQMWTYANGNLKPQLTTYKSTHKRK